MGCVRGGEGLRRGSGPLRSLSCRDDGSRVGRSNRRRPGHEPPSPSIRILYPCVSGGDLYKYVYRKCPSLCLSLLTTRTADAVRPPPTLVARERGTKGRHLTGVGQRNRSPAGSEGRSSHPPTHRRVSTAQPPGRLPQLPESRLRPRLTRPSSPRQVVGASPPFPRTPVDDPL